MKLFEAERQIRTRLENIYDEAEAANIAALAIEHLTGLSASNRLLKKEKELSNSQTIELEKIISRLTGHEPIQYIMNKCWFYGLELYVDKDVLIPRPETEELVDWIIKDVKASGKNVFAKKPGAADETTELKILDVGTGSGCIALALKRTMPLAEVWGCDISDRALNVARRNGSELNIRVDFQSVDYLDPAQQKHLPTVDILVSNPPYVPQKDKEEMRPNVLQYEPHTALFVDNNDPLVFYKALVEFGKHRLYPHGVIYMEIHENLGQDITRLFETNGYQVELRKDMQGKNRMVKAGRNWQ
ncbi:MAG TPA: peptide chain release factor N(5)-glutamine methyltransferase [Flavisolibacter sp.]